MPIKAATNFLTMNEVATMCRVTRQTIHAWLKDGRFLSPVQVGHKLLWPAQVVEKFMLAQFREEYGEGPPPG